MAISLSINNIVAVKREKCMRYVVGLAIPTIISLSQFVAVEQAGVNHRSLM